jgi:hypothetical protein
MKHLRRVSVPSEAQTNISTILTIVGTVMSSIGALLLSVAPLISK